MDGSVTLARRQSRRRFARGILSLAGLGLLSACGALPAQVRPATRVRRIGYLALRAAPDWSPTPESHPFVSGLQQLGWVQGQNISIELRNAEREEVLPAAAAELVSLDVDLIYVGSTTTARAAKDATDTIPIVMGGSQDAVENGLIASLAAPGGNVTGLTVRWSVGLATKMSQLLKDTIPGMSRVAIFWNPAGPDAQRRLAAVQVAATSLNMQPLPTDVRSPAEFATAYSGLTAAGAQALQFIPDALFTSAAVRLANLALDHRVPAIHSVRSFADAGGLLAYDPNLAEQNRRAAVFADKILKGARPADLPVEQPTRYDFVINLKTAGVFGLTIPESVRAAATDLIQ